MPKLSEIQALIERGVNQFIAVCTNSNRDLPFHDYKKANANKEGFYVVGSSQINGTGDQKKHFISKSTLIFCNHNIKIRFNSANNTEIFIFANTYYEFKSNIHSIYWVSVGEGEDYIDMWFEGVMYHEARRPE
jgi:hypothetical protein